MNDQDRVRIDKWLWAARFYKTRALAAEAVSGGHVHINHQRIKPSRPLQVGDELQIRKGQQTFVVTVRALAERRGPASQAQQLYEEHVDSVMARAPAAEQRKLLRGATPAPGRRPDKRARRRLMRLARQDD
ncbi:MAG: RNA-binding S4 domain-containing protein [Pseudomonadota bacterium]|nr:MAG: RNA-binding S4 domain-containing protein [Pseudomonadota bacterium]